MFERLVAALAAGDLAAMADAALRFAYYWCVVLCCACYGWCNLPAVPAVPAWC